MTTLTTIAFDADDTLWHHEKYFVATKDRFAELLSAYAPPAETGQRLHDVEIANVGQYGFGVKSFTLSMLETAITVVNGDIPGPILSEIVELGRAMLTHPVDPFPGVRDTLAALKPSHKLLVITRGDLFDQERKLAASGLLPFFDEIEIVSDKTPPVYERIFNRHGDGPARSMMIGNSMRADVVPALAAGAWGIHVPSEHVWSLDLAEEPQDDPRFRRLPQVADVLPLIREIG
jgi:putative hydrolase of the HAD superfamily